MRISSASLPQPPTHFSDGTRLVLCAGPSPEPKRAVCALLKTCNQLYPRRIFFFSRFLSWGSRDASAWNVNVLRMLHAAIADWRSGQALHLRGSLARYAPAPTPRFVRQSFDALLQKSPRPFVDKAPADPDPGSNVRDWDPIGYEEDNPGTPEQPDPDGGRPLPGEQPPAFLRREGDGERGFTSTSHTAPLSDTGECRQNMRVQVCSGDPVWEGRPRCHRPAPSPSLSGRRCLTHAGVVKILLPGITIPFGSPHVYQRSTDLSVRGGLAWVSVSALQ